jgi:hypothetical protein
MTKIAGVPPVRRPLGRIAGAEPARDQVVNRACPALRAGLFSWKGTAMQKPNYPDGMEPSKARGEEPETGVEEGEANPVAPTPDGEEQSQTEAFDEEGAGIAAKE